MSGSDAQNNVQAKPIAGQRRAVARLHARLHEVMLDGWPASIFAMTLALLIMGQSRPWSDRYLFSALNAIQRLKTPLMLTMLKRVEHLSAVTFRTSLEGRSARSVGRESVGLKRSVRVQAFTRSRSLDEAVC
jgi:hypothetical protein